jgi:uncharacterized protein (TIGR02118 family)
MTMLLVTYKGSETDRFDREYYVNKHLPMAREFWRAYGLISIEAFFPSGSGSGTVAACHIVFCDDESLQAAYVAPGIERLLADCTNFTDLTPVRHSVVTLDKE